MNISELCNATFHDVTCTRAPHNSKGAHRGSNKWSQWFTDDCYESLEDLLGNEWPTAFRFDDYAEGEQMFLKPLIERKGYTHVIFIRGETDSFGPLTRIACAVDSDGLHHQFVYG